MAKPGSDSVNRFGRILGSALRELESRQREIDDLNVFPVADGDTGRNMVMTLRGLVAALESLRGSVGEVDLQEVDRDLVVDAVARAALASAHGNSGVILSQLIRGAARGLGSAHGAKVSPHLLGKAMRGAAEQGLAAIPEPREGTILTVARDIADALESAYPEPVLIDDDIAHSEQDALLAVALEIAVEAGSRSVDRGPELMELLREKGVVDAGGYGLVVILAGALAGFRGESEARLPHRAPTGGAITLDPADELYSFCVNFTVTGSDFVPSEQAARVVAAGIGDSVLVVGHSDVIRVHIHTDDPSAARALFDGVGEVHGFEQEDMNEQIRSRDKRLASRSRLKVIVASSDPSAAELFEDVDVEIVTIASDPELDAAGSPSRLSEALDDAGDSEVVVVATSGAVLEAAGRVLVERASMVEVVPTGNLSAAVLALAGLDSDASADGAAVAAERLRAALGSLRTAEIRHADEAEGHAGQLAAVSGGLLLAVGGIDEVLAAVRSEIGGEVFVTALIDPGGPIGESHLAGMFGELDAVEIPLGGSVATFAGGA